MPRRRKNITEEEQESEHSSPEAINELKYHKMSATPVTFDQMKELFDAQAQRQDESEQRIRSDVRNMVEELKAKIKECQDENATLRSENVMIKARLLQVERETRKCNLVASGIEFSTPREGFEQLEKTIENAIGHRIKISGLRTFVTGNGKRIVASCGSLEDKKLIMANKKLMKFATGMESKPVFLDDDLPKDDREIHSHVRGLAKKMRDEGKNARASRNRVKIEDSWFFWCPLTNQLQPCTFPGSDKTAILERPGTAEEGGRN